MTSANVVYLLEQPANAGSTLVYYKIIGQSSHPVTVVDSTISEWHSTVYTQQIPNISIVDVVYTPTVPLPSPVPIPVPVLVIPASPWDGVYGVAFDGTVWAVELSCGTIRRGINGTWDNLGLSPVQNIAWAQVSIVFPRLLEKRLFETLYPKQLALLNLGSDEPTRQCRSRICRKG